MDDGTFGAASREALVSHSIPRYWTPVYLLAALPPILFFGRARKLWLLLPGSLLIAALACVSIYEISDRQPTSLRYVRNFVRLHEVVLDDLAERMPHDAIVYTQTWDKVLWSRFTVGIVSQPDITLESMTRALQTNRPIFIVEPFRTRQLQRLRSAMPRARLRAVQRRIRGSVLVYEVQSHISR
jgi:hypothetical protein